MTLVGAGGAAPPGGEKGEVVGDVDVVRRKIGESHFLDKFRMGGQQR